MLEELNLPTTLTNIGGYAFSCCSTLTEITIPPNVEILHYDTFSGCRDLKSVILSEGITDLEMCVFYGCESLETIVLPSSLQSIGDNAFTYCRSLETLFIPDGVSCIHGVAFPECTGLAEINVDINNQNYCSESGALFTKDKTKLIVYPSARPVDEYTVPASVIEISQGAFDNNRTLRTVHLPDTLTMIGDYAFVNSYITSINIPKDLEYLGTGAFSNCASLRGSDMIIPGTVKEIGDVFGCAAFRSLIIEEGVTRIGNIASTLNYASEATITLPVSLKSIADRGIDKRATIRCHHDTVADAWAQRNGNKNCLPL